MDTSDDSSEHNECRICLNSTFDWNRRQVQVFLARLTIQMIGPHSAMTGPLNRTSNSSLVIGFDRYADEIKALFNDIGPDDCGKVENDYETIAGLAKHIKLMKHQQVPPSHNRSNL
jgi:hypothetical protein